MATSHRRRVVLTPAAHALLGAGCTVTDLGETLGVGQSMASHYLSGRRRLPERFPSALRSLIDDDAAARVIALIPERR